MIFWLIWPFQCLILMIMPMADDHEILLKASSLSLLSMVRFFSSLKIKMILKIPNKMLRNYTSSKWGSWWIRRLSLFPFFYAVFRSNIVEASSRSVATRKGFLALAAADRNRFQRPSSSFAYSSFCPAKEINLSNVIAALLPPNCSSSSSSSSFSFLYSSFLTASFPTAALPRHHLPFRCSS